MVAGTHLGFTKVNIVLCGRSYPRIFLFLLNPPPSLNYTDAKQAVDPTGEEFLNTLLANSVLRSDTRSATSRASTASLHSVSLTCTAAASALTPAAVIAMPASIGRAIT